MKIIYRLFKTAAFHMMLTLNGLLLFVCYLAVTLLCAAAWPFQKLICFTEFVRRKLLKWRRSDMTLMRAGVYRHV